jgi:hypothetical protein
MPTSTPTEPNAASAWSEMAIVAESIAARLRPAIPESMELVVEPGNNTASLNLEFREFEPSYEIARVDRSGICVRDERGYLRRTARSLRGVNKVIPELESGLCRYVRHLETSRVLDTAYGLTDDMRERLRAVRTARGDADAVGPIDVGTHWHGTDISLRIPNEAVIARSAELYGLLLALQDLATAPVGLGIQPPVPAAQAPDAALPGPRLWRLLYQEPGGGRHVLGDVRHPGPLEAATVALLDLFWDDRLDGVACSPVVLEVEDEQAEDAETGDV